MPSGKKLGLFWGSNAFSILESNQDAPVKSFRVPFQSTEIVDTPQHHTQTDDARLASVLKDALRGHQIVHNEVYLALPSKDIVIRSFIIPFLKPNEIKGVVEFEIKKYIPFNLKELAYSFHASPLVEDKVKRLRIHFVAIRREILEHYSAILKQAGLNVVFSEPAPMCLTKALIAKKFIKPEQKVAVVQTDFHDSRIIVFDNGVVQFVRDFQLHNPALNTPAPEPELLKKKLFNEIKISLDFYMRQFKSEKISEILTISFDPDQDIIGQLQQELEMPVRKIDPHVIVSSPENADIGLLNAYGAVVAAHPKAALFNLSGLTTVAKPMSMADRLPIPEEYFPAVKMGVICLALVVGVLFLSKINVAAMKKKHDLMVDELGAFLNMSLDDIKLKIADNNERLETNKKIFRKTEMASFLVRLPKLLPPEVWLTDLSIQYVQVVPQSTRSVKPGGGATQVVPKSVPQAAGILVDLGGFVYTKDTNQQFRIVYGIVDAFKADDLFKKYMSNVNLSSIQSQQKEKLNVTSFKINGK